MRSNKNRTKIILAATVAIIASVISYSAFKNMNGQLTEQQKLIEVMQKVKASHYDESSTYAVAKADLKAGEIVSDEDVDFKQFDTVNPNAFDNRSDVVNKVLLQDITSGTEFTSAHIAKISNDDVTLKEGYRALTLPTTTFQGRSNKMTAGTAVDIFSSTGDSSWVMENVRIISAEGSKIPGVSAGLEDATTVTFEVPADSISDFISNASKGNLVLVARNANDKKVYHKTAKPKNSYNGGAMSSLPNLPSSVPIGNFSGGNTSGNNLSGLPMPIQPVSQGDSVELIEANVKSKVTFD